MQLRAEDQRGRGGDGVQGLTPWLGPATSPSSTSGAARARTPVPGSLRVGKCHPRALCGLVWGAQCSLKSRGQPRAGESSTPSTQLQQTQIKLPDEKIRNDPCLSGVSPREKSRLDHWRRDAHPRSPTGFPTRLLPGPGPGIWATQELLQQGTRWAASRRSRKPSPLPRARAPIAPQVTSAPLAPTCCPPCKSEQQRVPAASCCGAGSEPVPPVYPTSRRESQALAVTMYLSYSICHYP